jgi:hypothetical protein
MGYNKKAVWRDISVYFAGNEEMANSAQRRMG